jgi:hypothetical protein
MANERANDVAVFYSTPDIGTDVDDHGKVRQEVSTVTGLF